MNNSIPDVSGFVTKTTYDAGQAAQDTVIAGKADKVTSFKAVVYPNFMYSNSGITFPIKAGTAAVFPLCSLKSYIYNPYITPNSTVTFDPPPIWNVRYIATGSGMAKTLHDLTPTNAYVQSVNLFTNQPAVTAADGYIKIDFSQLLSFGVYSSKTEDIDNIALHVNTDPITLTVTL